MTGELLALVLGTALAVGALAFVLYPLFFDVPRRVVPRRQVESSATDDSSIRALREIEFDRATGKLSDADYAELKRDYGNRAVREMRLAGTPPPATPTEDAVEAKVRAWRASHAECRTCGVRPESDAIYCSTCGGYLDARCGTCGTEITESSAGFCSACGAGLGAATR
jgi:hypothetical protein